MKTVKILLFISNFRIHEQLSNLKITNQGLQINSIRTQLVKMQIQ